MRNHRLTLISIVFTSAIAFTACENKDTSDAADDKAASAGDQKADAKAEQKAAEEAAHEATCGAAAKNLMAIMKPEIEKQLSQIPEEQRAMAEQQMKAEFTLEKITAQCEQQKPGKEELGCVTKAKTPEELQACQGARPPGGMPPGHPAPPPPAAPGGAGEAAPGGPGGEPPPPPAGGEK